MSQIKKYYSNIIDCVAVTYTVDIYVAAAAFLAQDLYSVSKCRDVSNHCQTGTMTLVQQYAQELSI